MPPKPIDNERRACDAVARVLEERHGATRANATSPEDVRVGPPVEYVFDLASRTYALEHSVVEAFDGQIYKDVDFAAFVAPIETALDHHMPSPGSYRLTFAIHPSQGLKPKRIPDVQAAIIAWVREAATAMHAECPAVPTQSRGPHGHESHRRGTVEGVDLHLHREIGWSLPEVAYGRVFCGRFAPPDYETLRVERSAPPWPRSCPSYRAGRTQGRVRCSCWKTAICLCRTTSSFSKRPRRRSRDDVMRRTRSGWSIPPSVWCLMRDGLSFPDEETPFRYRDFRPEHLAHVGAA